MSEATYVWLICGHGFALPFEEDCPDGCGGHACPWHDFMVIPHFRPEPEMEASPS